MALPIKQIPTLVGTEADKFIKMSAHNLTIKHSIDFSEQAKDGRKILKKAKLI